MLKDRRVLLEHDLKTAHERASTMYLDIVVTNSNAQYSLQLPVSPFAVGDSVCDLMQEQPQCVTVSSNGYSLMMSGQPKVMMRSRSTSQ